MASPLNYENPDDYRMTIGEHLDELRARLIKCLIGFILAAIVCLTFGTHVVAFFCKPLMQALEHNKLNPQIFYSDVADSFMIYVKISFITAGAITSPWIAYQIWSFVAAGLYPKERKYITKYLPLSITLLIVGMIFMYYVVLPLMLEFFVGFNIANAVTFEGHKITPTTQSALVVPTYDGDPATPLPNQLWVDGSQRRLKMYFDGEIRVLTFASSKLASPQITLPGYINLIVQLLVSFGLAFQMPLVVLALIRIGIVPIEKMRSYRGPIYFGITVLSAMIVPDVATGMVALMIPLFGLFELGLILAARQPPPSTDT